MLLLSAWFWSTQLQSVGIVAFEENNDLVAGRYPSYDRYSSGESDRTKSHSSESSDLLVTKEPKMVTRPRKESSLFSIPTWLRASKPTRVASRDRTGRESLHWPLKGRESRSQSMASTVSYSSCECEPSSDAEEAGQGGSEADDDSGAATCCDPITLDPFETTTVSRPV
jgi:hypothetical protein